MTGTHIFVFLRNFYYLKFSNYMSISSSSSPESNKLRNVWQSIHKLFVHSLGGFQHIWWDGSGDGPGQSCSPGEAWVHVVKFLLQTLLWKMKKKGISCQFCHKVLKYSIKLYCDREVWPLSILLLKYYNVYADTRKINIIHSFWYYYLSKNNQWIYLTTDNITATDQIFPNLKDYQTWLPWNHRESCIYWNF